MQTKKIISGAVVALSVFFLSGCQDKTEVGDRNMPPSANEEAAVFKADPEEVSKLKKPTGKVDDTVSAIYDEAGREKDEMLSDEAMAKSAVDDLAESGELLNSININDIN